MATLVLTTLGSIVGGPIGGAIGAVIGQSVDQRILAPKGRRGPRLGDLSIQTSSYGSAIPKLFGMMRVAGTVIWATDLVESSQSGSTGKGQPRTTAYSYSASFAVALSGRPIVAVRRIWADGKLLRGSGGDWKTPTGFRLHHGSEDQPIDPLIASAEGIGAAPAYRGIAYAVFEDLQLADFGNRIPSLTFEVEADTGSVRVTTIVDVLSDGAVTSADAVAGVTVAGYAASGDSVRGAVEVLADLGGMSISDDGSVLRLEDGGPIIMPAQSDLGASAANGGDDGGLRIDRIAAGALPDEVTISYYEPARDYQTGLQRARRAGPGRRVDSIELPAALSADGTKAAAEGRLARTWAERVQASLALPPRAMGLRAGATIALPGDGGTFRVASWTLEHMVLKLQLAGSAPPLQTTSGASPGRPILEADEAIGSTILALLDLPPLDDQAVTPRLWIAAAGTGRGWRKAQLLASIDGGVTYEAIGQTAQKAVIGTALNVLAPGDPALFDDRLTIDVVLSDSTTWLESRNDDALIAGANLAMLGDELIQFGRAEPIGPGQFRLGRLLRGRRGSEAAMAVHDVGEPFVLLDPASLKPFDVPSSAIGTTVRLIAIGVGDGAAAAIEAQVTGRALRPPSPVHLNAWRLPDGTIRLAWTRRSRVGWPWIDGADAPLAEEVERYRLTISVSGVAARSIETSAPAHDYPVADQIADGASGEIDFAVIQIGALAASFPAARGQFNL
jgi:hypothetical protein